ncbi:uncharacterized protein PRCAT00003289001 [Priceomyces carsonii]|uniref:uncharacterized protein n=1 Tax=Priceomyces carsonii TaxID=28549 RepID=UPI002EDBAE67|nr:unnamed protein product [Priceomyces carsonii]
MDSFFSNKNTELHFSNEDIPTLHYTKRTSHKDQVIGNTIVKKRYENNTYIDWILETFNVPKGSKFITHKWTAIVLLSIVVGYVTSFIDLVSVWLNDVKKGLCFSKLNKWSLLDPYLTCPVEGWYNWSEILIGKKGIFSNIFINFPVYLLFALLCILVAAFITIKKEPLVKQSGIPEIKLIVSGLNYNISEYLGVRTLLYKIIGLIVVVSSGVWLGKEGPFVHVSCCIQNIVYFVILGKTYDNEAVRRELLSAAVATGISVAFNSPIGGVLFVLESIPSFYVPTRTMWNAFFSATIAVVVVNGFKIFTEGQDFSEQDLFLVLFGNFSWLFMEVIPFIVMGAVGGLYGFLFISLNSMISTKNIRFKIQRSLCNFFKVSANSGAFLEIILMVIVTTILNFPIEISKLPLAAYLKILFTDCSNDNTDSNSINFMCHSSDIVKFWKLSYILVQGFFLASYTFGTDLPGGILMPTLVLGATFGRLVGITSQAFQKKFNWDSLATCTSKTCLVSPSSYAVVSAAAFMTGITKLTMCVVVIMFELTGAVTYVLPIMISVMTLKILSDWLCSDNIYDTWLKTTFNLYRDGRGDFNEGKGNGLVEFTELVTSVKQKLPDMIAKSIMVPVSRTKCLSLMPAEPYTASSLILLANEDNHEGYPIILSDLDPVYLGYTSKMELLNKLSIVEDSNAIISFQIENLPTTILSQQLHYEQSYASSLLLQLDLMTEDSAIILNELTPIVEVLEIFEKLNLNYITIRASATKKNQMMVGFVDRFILSRLIDSEFAILENTGDSHTMGELNEQSSESDTLFDNRQVRSSVELIT